MKLKISAIQTQKQILAPSMQQSIEVLLLPVMELNTLIQQELETNPLLEIDEIKTDEQGPDSDADTSKEIDQMIDDMDTPYRHDDKISRATPHERPLSYEESLEASLLRQLAVDVSDPLQLEIGRLIIGNIDEDGYLKVSCEEIAEVLNIKDIALVAEVLDIIQQFEPTGIASRDIRECLLMQIKSPRAPAGFTKIRGAPAAGRVRGLSGEAVKPDKGINGKSELVYRIIDECLDGLGQKKFSDIARKLSVPLNEVKAAAQLIATLEPRPARNFRPVDPNIYIKPDIIVTKDADDNLQIVINNEELPSLRINNSYKTMLKNPRLSAQEKDFIKERLKNALFFIRSVEARGQTMRGIAHVIVDAQKEFFDKGHLALKPMSLKDVARKLDRNESTISRAIQNKYVDTPRGLFPLKYFFSQAVGQNGANSLAGQNGCVSNRSIKEEIRQMIDEEDKSAPLSDQEIQKIFEAKGMKLARRTISKYRQMLRILPSHLRRQ